MRFENVAIVGLAHADATERVTSREIEDRLAPALKRLGMPSGVLEALTGIRARRLWAPGVMVSQAATLAAGQALQEARVSPAQVGILINTSVCRDFVEPSTASLVHASLGLPAACLNFDLCNACLAFLNGMEVIGNMIERGQIEYGVVVDGESSRFVLENTVQRLLANDSTMDTFRQHFATLTLGSGAAAMVLGHRANHPDKPRFTGSVTLAATEFNHLCRGQNDHMETDSQGLLVAGVEIAQQTFEQARQQLGWERDLLHEVVLHQVSRTHTERIVDSLGVHRERVLSIYPEYGNVGPASVPIALSMAARQGRLQKGKRVALMGIGSGLNCTIAEVLW